MNTLTQSKVHKVEKTKSSQTSSREARILFYEGNPFNTRCDNCTRGIHARYAMYHVSKRCTYYVCEFCKNDIEYLEQVA